jgi:hypothetical protein
MNKIYVHVLVDMNMIYVYIYFLPPIGTNGAAEKEGTKAEALADSTGIAFLEPS